MLHDPSHYEPPPIAHEIEVSDHDKAILRTLASELAEVAALPVHEQKAELWRQLNDLEERITQYNGQLVYFTVPFKKDPQTGEIRLPTDSDPQQCIIPIQEKRDFIRGVDPISFRAN